MKLAFALLFGVTFLFSSTALAQDTLDLGTLKNEEIVVVQKLLYPKTDKSEIAFQLGAIAFDPYMLAPKVQLSFERHRSETMSFGAQLGAGYGLGKRSYRELGGTAYGVRPEAYRYVASLTGGANWSPIYAKLNWQGVKVHHFDIYFPFVVGATLERLAWGEEYFTVAPGVGVGVGFRVFQGDNGVIKLELRDDLIVESRKQSGTVVPKQNIGIHLGFGRMTGGK
ncbi:MAG TPA: hypothetical protein QGF58_17575 [Myxococcota bacterium]|nr:hypothetical protein [Myxococcota bacterium]